MDTNDRIQTLLTETWQARSDIEKLKNVRKLVAGGYPLRLSVPDQPHATVTVQGDLPRDFLDALIEETEAFQDERQEKIDAIGKLLEEGETNG